MDPVDVENRTPMTQIEEMSYKKEDQGIQRVPDNLHEDLTGEIIGAFYHVYNTLGYGFLEAVYQNALMVTLRKQGHQAEVQQPVDVHFEGVVVGHYYADLIVDHLVIIELKSVETLCEAH